MTRDASPYRLVFDGDFDGNLLKSLTLRPDDSVHPTTSKNLTERAGFEPAVPNGHTGFRNQLDQPLRHLSVWPNFRICLI